MTFYPMMAGERELFEIGKADAERARALFANQGLHAAASAFAVTHERAIQYLEQAPALIFPAMAGGPGGRLNVLWLQFKLVPLCETGAPLKEVMRAFHIPPPLRKLKASALFPRHGDAVAAMVELDPAMLGRVVPDKPGAQKKWLSALCEWRQVMVRHRRPAKTRYGWAVERLAEAAVGPKDVGVVADFASASEPFNEAWHWPRASEEATLWHDRLTVGHMLRGTMFKPDSVIDTGKHEDDVTHIDFRFVALRTPAQIAEEGTAMRHCVASYIPRVIRGDCHIVSIQRRGQRIATLELSKRWGVQQLKGKFNATPTATTTSAAHFYAALLSDRMP